MPSYVTSDVQLDRYFQRSPSLARQWGGCWAKDQLPTLQAKGYIVNLKNSTAKSAVGHWVAVWNGLPGKVLYFDSMGETDPPNEVLKRMRATGKQVVSSTGWFQSWNSDACGLYCAYWLKSLMHGEDPTRSLVKGLQDGGWSKDQRIVVRGTKGVL